MRRLGWFRVRTTQRRRPKNTKDYMLHKEAARALVAARLPAIAATYGVLYGGVSIRNQSTRWGSCSKARNLNFNYRIVHLDEALVEYLIVHEVCHLIEFNHSEKFWRLVAQQVPGYVHARARLRAVRLG